MNTEEKAHEKYNLEARFNGGAGWFTWIAGLSLINTAVFMFGGNMSFIAGLGITQLIDGFAYSFAREVGLIPICIAIFLDVLIAAGFYFIGRLSKKRKKAAFITGMVLYGLDALIFLWVSDYMSIAFHGFALWGIFRGLKALKLLAEVESKELEGDMET